MANKYCIVTAVKVNSQERQLQYSYNSPLGRSTIAAVGSFVECPVVNVAGLLYRSIPETDCNVAITLLYNINIIIGKRPSQPAQRKFYIPAKKEDYCFPWMRSFSLGNSYYYHRTPPRNLPSLTHTGNLRQHITVSGIFN